MNEVLKVLKERRSCRSYRPEQITDEELNAVLEAGTYAPTARGQQSPIIVAVQNPAVVEQLRKMNAAVLGTPEADPFYGAPTVLVVLALGITYPLLEGVASWLIVRSRLPGFTLRHGIDNAWMGTFGNVICLGAGAVPMQTYYLHRCGLGLGPGVGLMTLQYVFHKAAVLVYATVLLLWNRQWFTAHATGVLSYLPAAYTVVAGVILGLVLLCTAPLVQSLARRALGLLPKTEKWQARRESWQTQLDTLSEESRHLLTEKTRCLKIFAVHLCKLFLMYTIPSFCLRFMGLSSALSFGQVQPLTALMLFLSNALPNVAGMGSIETAFLLVFGSFLERGEVMSVMMLYRIASYYVVFAASAVGFFFAQRHLTDLEPPKED